MKLISEMLFNAFIKAYFYILGEEVITRELGEKLELDTVIDSVKYNCVCQEILYIAETINLFKHTRVSRLYKVTMNKVSETTRTHGTYPLLCSDKFVNTHMPHMTAIRCHHNLFYQ